MACIEVVQDRVGAIRKFRFGSVIVPGYADVVRIVELVVNDEKLL